MASCPKCSKPVPDGAAHCTHCNALLPSEIHDQGPRPKVNTRFDVSAQVGVWGTQKVFLARNRSNQDEVALRLLPASIAGEEAAKDRINALLVKGQGVKNTPGIVAVLGFEVEDGQPYFIQEIAAGTTLADRLKAEKHLPVPEVLRIGAAVADALVAAQAKGLPHGDLRPGCVLLAEDGTVRVTDFGVGKVVTDYVAKAQSGGGGPKPKVAMYHAPEILRTDLPDPKSDLFNLGCLLFEAATGDRHFPDGYRASCGEPHKGYPFHDPLEAHRDLDENLGRLVRKLLAPNPADRLHDAAEAAAALRGGAFIPAKILKPGEKPPPPPKQEEVSKVPDFASAPIQHYEKKRGPGIYLAVGGAVVLVGVVLWMRSGTVAVEETEKGPVVIPFEAAPPMFVDMPGPADADVRGIQFPERVVSTNRRIWSLYDGAELVHVPAGPALLGVPEGPADEGPAKSVLLSSFLIDRHEVTVLQYKRFCKFAGRPFPPQPAGGTDLHPVVNVTWNDAEAYAKWAKRRLPTEAEWEKAARGSTGAPFPWGGEDDPSLRNAPGAEDGFEGMAPAGKFPKGQSPYGLLDVAGNAWEWCADHYAAGAYAAPEMKDPKGPAAGQERVVRGGSFLLGGPPVRITFRNHAPPGFRFEDIGFRCAITVTVEGR